MTFDNTLKRGTTLKSGTYAIRRVLGQGGFGITYEAEQVLLSKRVALKEFFMGDFCDRADDGRSVLVVKSRREDFKNQKKRFLNEARRMAKLSNPHLVPVHDLFEENDTAYYVMDFVEGESLSGLLKHSGRPFGEEYVTGILMQMLEALECIHHQQPSLCHLDIKPDNIMVTPRGKAMLIDFGASKYVSVTDESRSLRPSIAYTPGYAPVEQLSGVREDMGPWTDFYALGATLFNMLTGERPANPSVIISDRSSDKRYSIPLPSSLSERMRRLVLWMMSPDQIDRPQTEEEIHAFLGQGNEKHIAGGGVVYDDTDDSDEEDIDVEVITAGIASVEANPAILPVFVKGVSFNMVKVKGGTFMMGATPEQGDDVMISEKPAHQVTLSDYYIGETEVTQELWEAVMGENPSWFKGVKHPVECVSWDDCQEFIKKLNQLIGRNFRLPTEAEWEFAARGGTKSRHYKYSGSNNLDDVAWYGENSGDELLPGELEWEEEWYIMEENNCKPHPVGQKSPNELGLYDMSGNVSEWCEDWYDYGYYEKSSSDNPCNAIKAFYRVVRGGGWNRNARHCRVSYRGHRLPDSRFNILGLRLAL